MEDVCSADDDKCKKPNLSGVGMIEKGKCSLTGVLLRFRQLSLLECAKRCFITSNCTSINYRQNWKLCDLVMSDADGNKIADDSTCIKSNITTWKKSLAGQCADHNCKEGQKCQLNADGNGIICVAAYCKGLPNTPHAELQEPFGLRRNLDTGNKFKCGNGNKMDGKPFAVCKSPGHWKVLFNCTTKDACSTEDINGDLVTITTKKKWDFIIDYLEGIGVNNDKIWIGLKDKKWMTGNAFQNVFGFTDLTDAVFTNTCGVIRKKNKKCYIETETCTLTKKFLCEKLIG
ncbi:unnamed protein product [Mytilus coruscus]|uniref:C-type lectin domain-containing protein n=1 Tax=Mytilus coruscus TaxID=42192 RepID=A0A6J8EA31_MYTCO|nr:unnamed protein product [Mytilus coruscus]